MISKLQQKNAEINFNSGHAATLNAFRSNRYPAYALIIKSQNLNDSRI
jgi:hypothetical protein